MLFVYFVEGCIYLFIYLLLENVAIKKSNKKKLYFSLEETISQKSIFLLIQSLIENERFYQIS